MKMTSFLSCALGLALCCKSQTYFPGVNTSKWRIDGNAVLPQDYAASHGLYTEQTMGITLYTSIEDNGTVTGDGDMSTVVLGGLTFGVALLANAVTVNLYEYIALIVRGC